MRGRLTDQDLTDYALNELDPHERLYVESMLGVSEECRHDVYEMLELSQLLEEGFEGESDMQPVRLTRDQRSVLTTPQFTNRYFWRDIAAILLILVGTAVAFVHKEEWKVRDRAVAVASASAEMHAKVVEVSAQMTEKVMTQTAASTEAMETLRALANDPARWLSPEILPESPAICTPPSWVEGAEMSRLASEPVGPWD